MIGDIDDMRTRLRLTMPARWFADHAPVLDGLFSGLSSVWSALYSLLLYVKLQSRIGTATNGFLDLAGKDLFSDPILRRLGETDDSFRARLKRAMRREQATRTGLIAAATEAGFTVRIFEPARPADTGAYNTPAGLAWNIAGGWGSLAMPLESLVTAQSGENAIESELHAGIAGAVPAGGVGWVRIAG
jgi:hypothetical protein